jgi:hypothetical protein
MHRGLQEQVKQFTNVAWVEEPGELDRRTENQYAIDHKTTVAEIQDRFAATGLLNCNGYKGSAQLTGDDMTITTSAHMFADSKTCKKHKNSTKGCTFTIKSSTEEKTVEVAGLFAQGFKCPSKPKNSDDWAVMKLKFPLKGVKPYRLPKSFDRLEEKEKVIAVNAYNDDYFYQDKATGEKTYPKTIEDCTSKFGYAEPVEFKMFDSTCDPSPGASGGSILKSDSKGDILVAITKGGDETPNELKLGEKGAVISKPYKQGKWAGYHVPVKGEFLEALRQATGIYDE